MEDLLYIQIVDSTATTPDVYAFETREAALLFKSYMRAQGFAVRMVSPCHIKRIQSMYPGSFGRTWATSEYGALRYYPNEF